jgi:hypothetical protein
VVVAVADVVAPRRAGTQVCSAVGCSYRQCVGLRQGYWSNHVGNHWVAGGLR